jgi:uncharacterized membrane protein YuzA (DUF378 family)
VDFPEVGNAGGNDPKKEQPMHNRTIERVAGLLAVVGALNWGLVALARFDLVAEIFGLEFGETNAATRVIYGLVGLSGVALAASLAAPDRHRAPARIER